MSIDHLNYKSFFSDNGYVIVKIPELSEYIATIKKDFEGYIRPRFNDDVEANRRLIKRFAESPKVISIFLKTELLELLDKIAGITYPVYCGPIVSHYTANDLTGASYGLPWHQDYPSMASSKKSVICWVALTESGPNTHGLNIISGHHKSGLLRGTQTDQGYEIAYDNSYKPHEVIPQMDAGDLIIMSCYIPHRTYVNKNYSGWKLSFSHRFDCLNDVEWGERGYVNSYNITVDRDLYLKQS